MAEHLIDQQRYQDMLFARLLPAWSVADWIDAAPRPVQRIQAREIRLTAVAGHVAFVRAFEIRGPLLEGIKTTLLQLGMVWAMSPPLHPDDPRIRVMSRLFRGHGEPPQSILDMSQSGIAYRSPWRWVVSAPRDQPIPLDSLHIIPSMYMGDHETYPEAGAAFDALMSQVVEGWRKGHPWDSSERVQD